jgi:hypothetical protein
MFGVMQLMNDPGFHDKLKALAGMDMGQLAKVGDQLECARIDLKNISKMLALEYGRNVDDMDGFDPRTLPLIDTINVVAGQTIEQPYSAASNLGRFVSRGFLENVGEEPFQVRFNRTKTSGALSDEGWSGWKTLKPSQIVDITFRIDLIDVRASNDGNAVLEVWLQ